MKQIGLVGTKLIKKICRLFEVGKAIITNFNEIFLLLLKERLLSLNLGN